MPNKVWICFDMIIIPIAASIPCIAALGNKSLNFPNFKSPKTIWNRPATTTAANARCQPWSPPPKAETAPEAITINPAAGPLIVIFEINFFSIIYSLMGNLLD